MCDGASSAWAPGPGMTVTAMATTTWRPMVLPGAALTGSTSNARRASYGSWNSGSNARRASYGSWNSEIHGYCANSGH